MAGMTPEGRIEGDRSPEGAAKEQAAKGAILVMDDDDVIRLVATGMIEHLGFPATACSNGEEAVALYRKAQETGRPFMAVILDLEIPGGMGGEETARELLALDPDARLVVSSGNRYHPALTDFRSYGFCCAMPKPYLLKDISRVLTHLADLVTSKKPSATSGE